MKVLYQCEVCGQTFDNPGEAMHCEESGPRPKFKAGEEVLLWNGFGDRDSTQSYHSVVVKEVIIRYGEITYRLGDERGVWPEISLRKKSS